MHWTTQITIGFGALTFTLAVAAICAVLVTQHLQDAQKIAHQNVQQTQTVA